MPIVIVILIAVIMSIAWLVKLAWSNPGHTFLFGTVAGGIYLFARSVHEERKRNKELERQRRLEVQNQQQLAQREAQLLDRARSIRSAATTSIDQAAQKLGAAERAVARAEAEFRARAYAPFWDAIQHAVEALCQYNAQLKELGKLRVNYRSRIDEMRTPTEEVRNPPAMRIPHHSRVTGRMNSIVRVAQTDINFALIFEPRRMNPVSACGSNLDTALREITGQLEASTASLQQPTDAGLRFVFDRS